MGLKSRLRRIDLIREHYGKRIIDKGQLFGPPTGRALVLTARLHIVQMVDTPHGRDLLYGGVIGIRLGDGANVVNVCSNAPTNSGNLNGITSDVDVQVGSGANKLWISGFADYSGHANIVASGNTVTGLAPATISYSGNFALLRLIGANAPGGVDVVTVDNPAAPLQFDGFAGADTAVLKACAFAVTLNMGANDDTVILSSDGTSAGNTDSILGPVTIDCGTGTGNTLAIYDGSGVGGKSVSVTDQTGVKSRMTGLTAQPINVWSVGGSYSSIFVQAPTEGGNTLDNESADPAWTFAGF